jgi:peptidoglycan-N-acetylglucosamine deacetylase
MSFLNSVVAPVLFPSILWHTQHRSVHLTFDDGPHPDATPRVLEILRKRDIRATFFLVGRQVQLFPEIAREILRQGHSIGNHGFSHASMIFESAEFQKKEIHSAKMLIADILGLNARFFRPPFGYFDWNTIRVAEAEGQKIVMWDVDGRDYSRSSHEQIANAVSRQTRTGSIVLLHDNESTAARVEQYLDPLLDRLVSMGFSFSAITQ